MSLSLALAVVTAGMVASCDDLDEAPDNRTSIDNVEKIQQLLTSGYPVSTPALICELSGDNLVDNNVVVPATHNDAYADFQEQAYNWEDIDNYSTGEDDTPYTVWEAFYQGIAVANHAIEAMREMSNDPAHDAELAHSWGEAHLLRAYLHFVLVNVFAEAYKDETQSANDVGIPYVSEVEKTVTVDYSDPKYRKSVAEVYRLIEQDILEGIDLINDAKYKVPAYHFNRNAANALAARFYLYKRDYEKCVKYATAALGSNPASSLRKWATMSSNTINTLLNDFNDETAPCNYMLQTTYSLFDRALSACRYAINTGSSAEKVDATKDILYEGGGPNWNSRLKAFDGKIYIWGAGQSYGSWLFRIYEYFEYDDKIAGIGWIHIIYQPFTAEETLLCRAEAEVYLGQNDKALTDLGYWTSSHMVDESLTQANINRFYRRTSKNIYVSELHPTEMSPEFKYDALSDDAKRLIDCVLHFRRIETMFEGLRWFDIKRYGITVHHAYRGPQEDDVHHDYLQWNDPRRVLQIPQNVIDAGYPSSNRTQSMGGQESGLQAVPAPAAVPASNDNEDVNE
ncbi:MAG: RagB/SusD family nutrient uptake outer membrane protein [Bacteroidaceae bacterium]|nr:RagB/SusD family nutrient uptake outer membrane protein [Bacteroidaceae bacterium]